MRRKRKGKPHKAPNETRLELKIGQAVRKGMRIKLPKRARGKHRVKAKK